MVAVSLAMGVMSNRRAKLGLCEASKLEICFIVLQALFASMTDTNINTLVASGGGTPSQFIISVKYALLAAYC